MKETEIVFSAPEMRDEITPESPPAVSEGSECPTCHRRVPHKKKQTSPETKVVSIRVPVSNVENFNEMLEATARHLEVYEQKHHKYWTIVYSLVCALQGPGGH